MLKKLLKYDLKWCLKVVSIYLAICLVLACAGRVIDLLPDSVFFNIIGGICKGAAISFGITAIVNAIIRSWVRLINNMYKDESYLTHTLPVSIRIIYLSKIISTLIVIAIGVITIMLSLVIMYLNENTIEYIKTMFNMLSSNLELSIFELVLILIFLLATEVIFIIFCGYFGIIYGFSYNNNKVGKTLLFGFGSYITSTVILMLFMLLFAAFNNDFYNIMFNGVETADFSLFRVIAVVTSVLYFIYIIVLYYMSNKKLLKGINID